MVWIKFLVLLIVFVIKSNAMSYGEIEDFSNFLRRTSQLDQTIKTVGVIGTADEDDDDLISDNAWEESGKFEGDLILNERQRRLIVEDVAVGLARNGLRDSTKKWPGNEVVFYIQPEHFSKEQTQAIQEGMDELARVSCVSFRPYKKGDKDAVVIQGNRRGCFSQVGYQGGYQVLNLSGRHPVGRGCFRPGTVVHELLHTLGFYHMQSSPDRDDYVDVLWDNIIDQAKNNFRKYNAIAVSDYGVGYDYDSVLHYSRRAFSSNGLDTLVPKQKEAEIGQRLALSEKDILKLNKMYCNADPNNFDADEVLTKRKSGSKKNNAKNKPFEGRGLGYQKGKPIVIRLPTAKNYRLNDHNILEYLSQLPQTVLSPSLDGRRVKEIEKSKINVPLITGQNKNAAVLETILDSATRNDESEENNELYRFIKPLGDITYVVRPDGTIQQEDERNIEDEEHSKLPSTYLLQNDIKHWNKLKTALNYDPLRLHLFSNKDILVKPKEGVTHETLRHELPTKEKKSKLHKANKKGMSTNRFLEEYNNDRLNQNYNMLLSGPVTLIENFYRPNEERTYLPSNDKSRKESQQSTGVTSFAPRDSYSKSKYIKLNRSNLDKDTDDKKINIKVSRAGVLPQEIKKYNKIREKQLDDSKIPPTSENSPAVLNKDRAPSKDTYTDYDDYSAIKSNVQNHYPSSLKDYNNYDNFDVTAPYYDISQQSRVLYSDIHSNPYQSSIEDDWDHSYEKYEYPFNLEHSRHNS